MKLKKIAVLLATAALFSFAVYAQNEEESTVEGEYMSTMEDVVVQELSNSDDLENKVMALQFLEEAANNGKVSPDMMAALDHLAGEGTNTQSRTKGRVSNNFPEVRREACRILGKVGTPEAAKTLNKIVRADNEPMVLSAAINSLGEIGYNDNDETTNTIAFYSDRFETLNPTSSLALEIVNAYEKLAKTTKDRKPMLSSLQRIAVDYRLAKPVRNRAKEVLNNLRGSDDSSNKKNER
ncbi:MAG: HEAT repeat domain-containing protein [Treponema sp.]|nr:HEAT repeat domain-containing protein [Treponema sp.]